MITGIPHDNYNKRGIAHARTNRKDDIFMQRLYIDKAHTALDIFRFAVFLKIPSALCKHNFRHWPKTNSKHTYFGGFRESSGVCKTAI